MENTAIDILSGLYANLDEQGTVFRISRSGTSLSIYDRELGLITHDMLTAVCCYEELIAGKNVSVRYSAPEVVNKLAAEFGKNAMRYLTTPADDGDETARKMAEKQPWMRDGIFMTVKLLSFMKKSDMSAQRYNFHAA